MYLILIRWSQKLESVQYVRVARYRIFYQVRTRIGLLCTFGVDTSLCPICYVLAQRGYELGRSKVYAFTHEFYRFLWRLRIYFQQYHIGPYGLQGLYWSVLELRPENELISIGFCEDVDIIWGSTSLNPTGSRIYMDLYGISNSKPKWNSGGKYEQFMWNSTWISTQIVKRNF